MKEVNPNLKRIGRITVTKEWLESPEFPSFLAFIEFVPVRAEFLYAGTMDYVGFSPFFNVLLEGEEAPDYIFSSTTHEDGSISYKDAKGR